MDAKSQIEAAKAKLAVNDPEGALPLLVDLEAAILLAYSQGEGAVLALFSSYQT